MSVLLCTLFLRAYFFFYVGKVGAKIPIASMMVLSLLDVADFRFDSDHGARHAILAGLVVICVYVAHICIKTSVLTCTVEEGCW